MISSVGPSSGPPLGAEQSHPHLVPRECDCFRSFSVPYWSDQEKCGDCWINPKPKEPRP